MSVNYAEPQLPAKQHVLRRISKKPSMMHYNRLMVLVAIVNLAILISIGLNKGELSLIDLSLSFVSDMVLINFVIAIVIRQHYVINLLFWMATRAPVSWPLWIRWTLGKVYHFGGIHVGCAAAATVWFLIFTVMATADYLSGSQSVSSALLIIDYALMIVLLTIVGFALPPIRARYHDAFERVHRLGGWTALALFWCYTILMLNSSSSGALSAEFLLQSYQFWLVALITFSIALPWLRLKKVDVEIVRPSSHVALVRFNHGVTPFAGSSTAISRNPLLEWHAFANVPAPGEEGFRLTISRAGDWTGKFIEDMPPKIWVKGIPTAGVANIEVLFKKVVYIATGSGIGPCLPHLLAKKVPALLVWSTRNPRKTYGDDLVDEILAVQPDAIIWDTQERGKPDMVKLAYDAYQKFGAEAVICISNKKLTWEVVYGMESRGIPAYGAIWDS